MTITHNGNEYQVVYQAGNRVQMTTAFRRFGNHIEILQIDCYEGLNREEVTQTTLHLSDLQAILNSAEFVAEQTMQEEQLALNHELNQLSA